MNLYTPFVSTNTFWPDFSKFSILISLFYLINFFHFNFCLNLTHSCLKLRHQTNVKWFPLRSLVASYLCVPSNFSTLLLLLLLLWRLLLLLLVLVFLSDCLHSLIFHVRSSQAVEKFLSLRITQTELSEANKKKMLPHSLPLNFAKFRDYSFMTATNGRCLRLPEKTSEQKNKIK